MAAVWDTSDSGPPPSAMTPAVALFKLPSSPCLASAWLHPNLKDKAPLAGSAASARRSEPYVPDDDDKEGELGIGTRYWQWLLTQAPR